MSNNAQNQQDELRRRVLTTIWGAILLSICFFFILTFVIPHTTAEPNFTLVVILGGLAMVAFSVSFAAKAKALSAPTPAGLQQFYIIAFALSEVPALLGLMTYLIAGAWKFYFVFFLFSFVAIFAHRPKASALDAFRDNSFPGNTYGS